MKKSLMTLFLISASAILLMLPVLLQAQNSVTFHVDNMQAMTVTGPWVFDADNIGFPTQDQQCLTFAPAPAYLYHLYTFKTISQTGATTITCTAENMPMVANPSEVALEFLDHNLGGYTKVNTVSPNGIWNIMGQAGDIRRYNAGTATIKHNGTPVLYLLNADLRIMTPFPTQAQMRAAIPSTHPFEFWVGDVGTGLQPEAYGWADLDMINSDPAWLAAYANADNQVRFLISNVVYAIDFTQGTYSYDLQLLPATHEQLNSINTINPAVPATWNLPLPAQDLTFNFTAVTGGGVGSLMNTLTVNEINTPPDGTLPGSILWSDVKFWDVMSTLGSYTTSITFDVTGLALIDPVAYRVLKRDWYKADWVIWSDITLVDPTHVRANNLTSLGDFAIGSVDDPLPVELSSFAATTNAENMAILNWSTQSETELSGYHIYRSLEANQSTAVCITTSLITAGNTSTGASYSFADNDVTENGTYYYWLEAMNMNGTSDFFGPVTLNYTVGEGNNYVTDPDHLGRSILKSYPNPFNPNTTISFYLRDKDKVTVTIYNTLGQVVKTYQAKDYNPGWHNINWVGNNSNGQTVPSGMYLVRLSGDSCNLTNKMILMK